MTIRQNTKTVITASILALVLTACQTEPAKNSGFLRDYSMLKANPEIEGQMRYENPSIKLASYKSFMIDPIVVHFAPNAQGVAINPDDLKALTDHFRNTAIERLSKDFSVVDRAGAGVLRIRVAITDISKTIPALNIHPGTKLTGAGLGGASMEAEALDSVSNTRVLAAVETTEGERMAFAPGLTQFGHAKQVMEIWVDRFVTTLKTLHGMK